MSAVSIEDLTAELARLDPADRAGIQAVQTALEQRAETANMAIGKVLRAAAKALAGVRTSDETTVRAAMAHVARLLSVASASARTPAATAPQAPAPLHVASGSAPAPAPSALPPAAPSAPAPAAPSALPPRPQAEGTRIEVDAELLGEFVAESRDHISAAELALLKLEGSPTDAEAIGTVFRAFHTVKGCAAILELKPLAEFAHHIESMLMRVRDGEAKFDAGCASLSLQSVDLLKEMVESLEASGSGGIFVAPAATGKLVEALQSTLGATTPSTPNSAIDGSNASPPQPPQPRAEAMQTVFPSIPRTAVEAAAPVKAPVAADEPPHEVVKRSPQAEKQAEKAEGSVRIRTDRLDRLIDLVGEAVIAQAMVSQDPALTDPSCQELAKKTSRLAKLVRELQDLGTSLRMVPLRPTFQKMIRVVRDTAKASGRSAELSTAGEDTEIDRNVVDVVGDPLVHMIRNAVDHGIERPSERIAMGKPAQGTISLRAYHSGGNVVLELADDGAGLDRARIVAKAISKKLIASDAGLSDSDVYNLIFEPGFSTRDEVTAVSGRGVGMDVVRRSIMALNGRVEITSELGKGTTFRLHVPLTLAITDGMLVRVGTERFVLPTASIQVILRPDRAMLATLTGRGELLMLRGQALPLMRLHRILGISPLVADPAAGVVVIINDVDGGYALFVDELLGQQQVVAKSMGALPRVKGISGGAILGDGRVGLILDTAAIGVVAREATHVKIGRKTPCDAPLLTQEQ